MVPKKGLEPPHPCGYMDLNHARLPIPPLRLLRTALLRHQGEEYKIHSTGASVTVKPLTLLSNRFRYRQAAVVSGTSVTSRVMSSLTSSVTWSAAIAAASLPPLTV